ERIDLVDFCVRHVSDDVGIELLECLPESHADRRDARLWIEDDDFCRNTVFLEPPRHDASTLVWRGRAAMRWRWQGHHYRTACEATDFPLQRQMLGIWDICRGIGHTREIGGNAVVSEPCLIGVTDAAR